MAYTKIFAIRGRLGITVQYAVNPDKTTLEETSLPQLVAYSLNPAKTEEYLFASASIAKAPKRPLPRCRPQNSGFSKQKAFWATTSSKALSPAR